jgi:hypothetical protein
VFKGLGVSEKVVKERLEGLGGVNLVTSSLILLPRHDHLHAGWWCYPAAYTITMTIVIVGASGRTSSYVLSALVSSTSLPVRAVVRSEQAVDLVRKAHPLLTDVESVGDYTNSTALDTALQSAHVVWYNAPAFTANTAAAAISVIDAAVRAGAEHFVYCSVLHPLLTKLINHKEKLP